MTRPLIQIDEIGTAREMTEEEFAKYEEATANPDNVFLPSPE
jgi:hypothetical protein